MPQENTKGFAVSVAAHAVLVGGVFLYTAFRPTPPVEKPPGAIVVRLDGNGEPFGDGGGNSPAPAGREDGDGRPRSPDTPPATQDDAVQRALDAQNRALERALREQQRRQSEEARRAAEEERRRQAAARAAAEAAEARRRQPQRTQPMTLDEFRQRNGTDSNQSRPAPSRPAAGGANTTPARIHTTGIDVGQVLAGGGRGGRGTLSGAGAGGSAQGGGPVAMAYEEKVKMLIQARWQALLDAEGRSLGGLSGEFLLNIGNNGALRFGGWTRPPGNALFERLLRRAIEEVGNIGSRPPAMRATIALNVVATPD